MNIKKRIIAVIGSQRSGTSAITRGIQALGVSLGDYTGPEIKRPDNEKGFFEDLEVSMLDVAMLNSIGLTWDNPVLAIFDENTREVLSEFFPIAENIMRRRLGAADLFGIKDPLIARLLPLWNEAFIKIGADVSYIIACRNPLSVAMSMQKRDNLDIVKGCYIWLAGMISALIYSEGFNRIVVDYDEVMKDPAKQLQRTAERLNLKFDRESPGFKEYKDSFLSESLRHTSFAIDDLNANTDVPPKITELYVLLKRIAMDEISIDSIEAAAKINKIYSWMTELRSTLLYMQAQFDALFYLKKETKEKDAKIAELTESKNMNIENHSSPCIVWHEHKIKRSDREKLKNQKGCVLWLTGLSGCGKSTIANMLEERLNEKGRHTYLLDGDNIRHGLSRGLGFSEEDRLENIKRAAEAAKLLVDSGIIVIASFISPLKKHRQTAKEIIGSHDFVEIFIDSPFHECVKRDAKGWYKRALNGEIEGYTAVDSPYEKPEKPDVHIKTNELGLEEGAARIIKALEKAGKI